MARLTHTIRLGRVGGIPVGAHWSLVAIVAVSAVLLGPVFAAWTDAPAAPAYAAATVAALLLMVSVLVHEVGHALTAKRFGVPTERITLWALGGVAELAARMPSAKAGFLIAAAGPAASLVVAVAAFAVSFVAAWAGVPLLVVAVFAWLAVSNVALAVFNLLPGAPLDGGRILASAIWAVRGHRARADLAAAKAGRVLGFAVAAFGVFLLLNGGGGFWLVLTGWFLVTSAASEATMAALEVAAEGRTVADVTTRLGRPVDAGVTVSGLRAMGVSSPTLVSGAVSTQGGLPQVLVLPRWVSSAPEWMSAAAVAVPFGSRSVRADEPLSSVLADRPELLSGEPVAVLDDAGATVGVLDVDRVVDLVRGRRTVGAT
jgi:Zn-dependent protease